MNSIYSTHLSSEALDDYIFVMAFRIEVRDTNVLQRPQFVRDYYAAAYTHELVTR